MYSEQMRERMMLLHMRHNSLSFIRSLIERSSRMWIIRIQSNEHEKEREAVKCWAIDRACTLYV